MTHNDSRGLFMNHDFPIGNIQGSPEIKRTPVISKKEKRSKKERKQRRGRKKGTLGSPFFSLYFINNNRTSLTVYTPDIYNCS